MSEDKGFEEEEKKPEEAPETEAPKEEPEEPEAEEEAEEEKKPDKPKERRSDYLALIRIKGELKEEKRYCPSDAELLSAIRNPLAQKGLEERSLSIFREPKKPKKK